MVLDLLAPAAAIASEARLPFALEIFERTASTPRVQQVVQLSLAPAFLLSGIGAVMNVIMSRMIWIAQRVENIETKMEDQRTARQARELAWLMRRRKLMQGAIMFSTAAAVMISAVIMLLFISAYITAQIGTVIAGLWVLTMALLVTGLGFFLRRNNPRPTPSRSPWACRRVACLFEPRARRHKGRTSLRQAQGERWVINPQPSPAAWLCSCT
jgi:Protein of unknown function (DUF2721)